jgi:hypothetical protein
MSMSQCTCSAMNVVFMYSLVQPRCPFTAYYISIVAGTCVALLRVTV